MSAEPLVTVEGLTKHYPVTEGILRREIGRVRAVDEVDLTINEGETLGLVGESGCGKTTLAETMLRLEEPTSGRVRFDGEDVTAFDPAELTRFRRRAQLIFQDPTSSFDPRMTVGESVAEPLRIHGLRDDDRRRAVVADLLERVGLEAADADRYPHEFSGGQKQRIALARALVVNPDLLVADEPVSALDVSVQATILSLLEEVQRAFGLSILFITHDLSVVREICDRVAVMYLGEVVEVAPTEALFADPHHPYTRALLASIPRPDPANPGAAVRLHGDVPDPINPPPGCRFHTRCPEVIGPTGYDLDQATWRGILAFRVRLRDRGIDVDAVREFVDLGAGTTDDGDPTDEAMAAAIRAEFDLPDRINDAAAEAAITAATDAILDGDAQRARSRLAEAFATPCVTDAPALASPSPSRSVACHLHDQRYRDPGGDDEGR